MPELPATLPYHALVTGPGRAARVFRLCLFPTSTVRSVAFFVAYRHRNELFSATINWLPEWYGGGRGIRTPDTVV